jgi:ABC-type multidrug transport system permease subunit
MLALSAIVSAVAALLILPGWLRARKWHPQSLWLFCLPLAGITFWMFLTLLRIGAQSLSNVIEIFSVAAAAIVAVIIVAVVTLGLRLFMPVLPE